MGSHRNHCESPVRVISGAGLIDPLKSSSPRELLYSPLMLETRNMWIRVHVLLSHVLLSILCGWLIKIKFMPLFTRCCNFDFLLMCADFHHHAEVACFHNVGTSPLFRFGGRRSLCLAWFLCFLFLIRKACTRS